MWEIGGLNPGCGTIVGGFFYQTKQLVSFSLRNMPSIVNLFTISPCGEAVNYRPYVSPSFEVAKPCIIIVILDIIILLLLLCFVCQKPWNKIRSYFRSQLQLMTHWK